MSFITTTHPSSDDSTRSTGLQRRRGSESKTPSRCSKASLPVSRVARMSQSLAGEMYLITTRSPVDSIPRRNCAPDIPCGPGSGSLGLMSVG